MPSRTERKREARAPKPLNIEHLSVAKRLAHTDKRVRDDAVDSVRTFLKNGGELGEGDDLDMRANAAGKREALGPTEMRRLWKGLFYCFWMSDKPLVQQRLAADLANLAVQIQGDEPSAASTRAALEFVAGFWEAMCREWTGIDRLRMDKFYLLIRRFVKATFDVLQRADWSDESVAQHNDILTGETGPLCPSNPKTPPSLAYHLADIWLEELEHSTQDGASSRGMPIADVLQPFISTLAYTSNSVLYKRLTDAVMQPLLEALAVEAEPEQPSRKRRRRDAADENERDSSSPYGAIAAATKLSDDRQIARAVCQAILGRASAVDDPKVKDTNRRRLYALVRQFSEDDDDDEDEA